MSHGSSESAEVANMLVEQTRLFRDKLNKVTGQVLSVEDTRAAVEAFECWLSSKELPEGLTSRQEALLKHYIDGLVELRMR